jgi:hypothetical protein
LGGDILAGEEGGCHELGGSRHVAHALKYGVGNFRLAESLSMTSDQAETWHFSQIGGLGVNIYVQWILRDRVKSACHCHRLKNQ